MWDAHKVGCVMYIALALRMHAAKLSPDQMLHRAFSLRGLLPGPWAGS